MANEVTEQVYNRDGRLVGTRTHFPDGTVVEREVGQLAGSADQFVGPLGVWPFPVVNAFLAGQPAAEPPLGMGISSESASTGHGTGSPDLHIY